MTLLVFSIVIAAFLAIGGTAALVVTCLIIARVKGVNTGRGAGRGRRPPAAPYRGRDRARTSMPPVAGGRRRDDSRPRAASQRRDW
ncbi:MAG TPA: hypothetical protein VGG75_40905 [Trebonia sp.]|jgi:hypothetical protein